MEKFQGVVLFQYTGWYYITWCQGCISSILWFYCDIILIDSQILIKRILKVPNFENRFNISHQISNFKHTAYRQMLKIRLNHLSRPSLVKFLVGTPVSISLRIKMVIISARSSYPPMSRSPSCFWPYVWH